MVNGPSESSSGLWCQVSGQRGDRLVVVARIVGELHRDRLGGSFRDGAVQLLDGPLGFHPLVEPYESHSFRKT